MFIYHQASGVMEGDDGSIGVGYSGAPAGRSHESWPHDAQKVQNQTQTAGHANLWGNLGGSATRNNASSLRDLRQLAPCEATIYPPLQFVSYYHLCRSIKFDHDDMR